MFPFLFVIVLQLRWISWSSLCRMLQHTDPFMVWACSVRNQTQLSRRGCLERSHLCHRRLWWCVLPEQRWTLWSSDEFMDLYNTYVSQEKICEGCCPRWVVEGSNYNYLYNKFSICIFICTVHYFSWWMFIGFVYHIELALQKLEYLRQIFEDHICYTWHTACICVGTRMSDAGDTTRHPQ